jgi:hypothetical protein
MSSRTLRKLVLPTAAAVLLALGAATVIATNPLDEAKDFSAIGVANLPYILFHCQGFTANGTLKSDLVGNASFTLTVGNPNSSGACRPPGEGTLGALTITKNDGSTLVMDVEVTGGADTAALLGTFSAPDNDAGPNGTGITSVVSSGKFQKVVGTGTIVFGTGYDSNTGTYDTTPTLHLNGTLVFP